MTAVRPEALAEATRAYAELCVELRDYLDGASLVLPNNEHFPDAVALDLDGVRTLFERVLSYTPLPADLAFELHVLTPDEDEGSSCSSGGCGPKASACGGGRSAAWQLPDAPLRADADGVWHVPVVAQETGNPVRLMSHLVRLAGDLLRSQADLQNARTSRERAVHAELAASACGLSPILLAASHLEQKACGGVRVFEGTALPTDVLAGLTVLFAEQHDERTELRRLGSLLQATPREALEHAKSFFGKRPTFLAQLRDTPERVAFHCDFGAEAGLFSRLFGKKNELPRELRT